VSQYEAKACGIKEYLLRIKEWLLANKLSLNVAKTEFLLIGSHHKLNNLDSQPSVNIGHDSIKQVQHSRVLGVEIDENLSWNKHIENVVKKVTSGIGDVHAILRILLNLKN
jgi:hypothetical protein